jgi:hypothetical protein
MGDLSKCLNASCNGISENQYGVHRKTEQRLQKRCLWADGTVGAALEANLSNVSGKDIVVYERYDIETPGLCMAIDGFQSLIDTIKGHTKVYGQMWRVFKAADGPDEYLSHVKTKLRLFTSHAFQCPPGPKQEMTIPPFIQNVLSTPRDVKSPLASLSES